jgi:Phosphoenolpyruvate carboxylase
VACLIGAAEGRDFVMHGRIGVLGALNRNVERTLEGPMTTVWINREKHAILKAKRRFANKLARRGGVSQEHPEEGMQFLIDLYREWPFFRTLLSKMDMVLAKSSIAIASRYAELVPDTTSREKYLWTHPPRMAPLDRDAVGHHGAGAVAAGHPFNARSATDFLISIR